MTNGTERLNDWVRRHLKVLELVGVVMRIGSFSLVSWLGPASPFLAVWAVNTCDAVLPVLKRDRAHTLLNVFWVAVGVVGLLRAAGAPA